ncbi:hypothetical protein BC628DRAFT_1337848 [Trametes gibbosa]|nr:hypothetical protein BC628DRAFT_1340793 [Trametes gibbosa]KAI0828187.1 hypothetical protein BC628DRAFT_1337848 [Trametes gibbosa]
MSNAGQPNHDEDDLHFPTPFAPVLRQPTLLLEQRIWRFAREVKEKPCWWEKVHDPDIVARWTQEIVEHDRKLVDEFWGGEKRNLAYTPKEGSNPAMGDYEIYDKRWPHQEKPPSIMITY